jgi:hypothetical protein
MTTVNFARFIAGAVTAVALAIGINPLSAHELTRENSAPAYGVLPGVGQRMDMPVSLLHAGADAAEVERVLGRPTMSSPTDAFGADRVLVYESEVGRTEVTLAANHVTAIALDLLPINSASLPTRARIVKPMMRRAGVVALLGKPDSDERGAIYGLETERMLFKRADQSVFSVLLAGGLVVDVISGNAKVLGVRPFPLPYPIPDGVVGNDLRIGLSPKQAASLLGPPVFLPIESALEGQPVRYETRFSRNGCGVVSLTFIGETLTAFAIWPSQTVGSLGDSSFVVADHCH